MKNHQIVDGRLLQTNKKWGHLKQKQRTWIFETAKFEYLDFIEKNNKLPRKKHKEAVIDRVYEHINAKEIWIAYYEVKSHVGEFIDKQNRKYSLNTNA